jgi:hypothetical protein
MLHHLFRALRAKLGRTAKKEDPDAGRLLFRFFDGRQVRRVDPWRTYREIVSDPNFNLETHLPAVERGEEPETTHCMNALCRAFGVQRYDSATGNGLSDWEMLNLLDEFTSYLDAIQKKTDGGPISSSPTAGTSSDSPAARNSTTNSSSDSGKTSNAPNTAAPSV